MKEIILRISDIVDVYEALQKEIVVAEDNSQNAVVQLSNWLTNTTPPIPRF